VSTIRGINEKICGQNFKLYIICRHGFNRAKRGSKAYALLLQEGKNMPTYEYFCLECGNKFDIFATLSEKEKRLKVTCQKCRSKKTSQVFGKISIITPGKSKSSSSSCPPVCPPGCSCP